MTTQMTCDEVRDLAAGFVLGALEDDDAQAVRDHLATCTEAHPEFEELGAVVPALAESVELVEPPAGLRGRVMAAAVADLAARTPSIPPAPLRLPERQPVALPPRRYPAFAGALMRLAAVLAIVVLGAWNVLLQGELDASRSYERDVAAVLDVASRPGALTAVLAGDQGVGAGIAAVDASGAVTAALRGLAQTSGDQVYEAWVIAADGIPVPLGAFTVGPAGTARFDAAGLPVAEGIVLALTLEPRAGSTTPTLPIVASGTASGG